MKPKSVQCALTAANAMSHYYPDRYFYQLFNKCQNTFHTCMSPSSKYSIRLNI